MTATCAVLALADEWEGDHRVRLLRAEAVDRLRAVVADTIGGGQ